MRWFVGMTIVAIQLRLVQFGGKGLGGSQEIVEDRKKKDIQKRKKHPKQCLHPLSRKSGISSVCLWLSWQYQNISGKFSEKNYSVLIKTQ